MTGVRMSIWWLPAFVILAVVAGLAIGLPLHSHHRNACEARGGHLGPKSLCITPDGRVIE